MELNAFVKTLHRSSELVKKWGSCVPPDGNSLRELLAIDGISIWDVMSVELALYLIPDGLAEQSGRRTIRQLLTPYLRRVKYAFWKKSPVNDSDCTRWPSEPTALFIGFTPYMARDVLQPIIDLMLGENGLTPVLLVADSSLTGDSAAATHSVNRHRSKQTVNEARRLATSIRRASVILSREERYREIFKENDRNLWQLVKHGVQRAFNVHASFILPDLIAVARHILTVHRPSVIVSIDTADPRTRVFSLLGTILGIPTVQVQSGPVDQAVVEWRFLLDDIVAAQGNQGRDVFLSHGVPPEKIHVTGSPRYDTLVKASDREISGLRARFGIPQENRIVVFASSYFLAIFDNNLAETGILLRAMKKAMFSAVAAVPGVTLIVKPHPLEDVSETRALVEDHSRVVFAEPTEDIRPLTSACDAFVSLGSTATLDALILGKPTICPTFPGWLFSDTFVLTGAVMVPRSENDIVAALREIVLDGGEGILERHTEQRNTYLASVVCDGGRGAARRIANLLNALAQPVDSEREVMSSQTI